MTETGGSSPPTCPPGSNGLPNPYGCGTVFKISTSQAPASAITAPVRMWLSESAIVLGSSVTLKWAVSNAFSQTMQLCNAFAQDGASRAGAWAGNQTGTLNGGLYSGEATITPFAGGTQTYALTCGGIESGFASLTVGAPRFAFHNDYNVTERRRGTRLFNNFGRHGWLGAIYVEHYFR